MKNTFLNLISLFLRIYASLFLAVNILVLPPMIWINQNVAFALSSPLFLSSKLQQNVLDALNIVIFNSHQSTKFIQSEVNHLLDVHVLFVYFYLFGLIDVIVLIKLFWKRRLPRKYFLGGLIFFVVLAVSSAIFFSTFFELFHQILFPQGNFSFPENSVLIQTFPPIFWLLQCLELMGIVCLSLFVQFKGAE